MADFSKEFLIRVRADIDKALKEMNRLTGEMKDQKTAARNEQTQVKGLSRTFTRLAAAAGAYITIQSAFKALRIADEYKQIQSQIRLATKETGDYVTVSEQIFAISQRNGTALQSTVRLFRSLARSGKELGATNADVLKVTEAIQQLAIMSGAGPEALRNAMLQFGQAMAAGVVRAEEFNSILENTPEVANRIAKGMDTTVGQLRLAVLEGTVLSKDVFQSLLKQAPQIAQEMLEVPDSIGRSTERLSNSFAQFLGQLDQATGTTAKLASVMNSISASMDEFVDARGLEGLTQRLEDIQNSGLRGRNRRGTGSAITRIKEDIEEALAALEGPQGLRHKLQQVEDEYNRTLGRTQELTREIESVPEDKRIERTGRGRNKRLTRFGQLNRDLDQANKSLEELGTEREALFNKLAAEELSFGAGEIQAPGAGGPAAAKPGRKKGIEGTIQGLEQEAAQYGMTASEIALYRLEIEGATQSQLDRARAAIENIQAEQEFATALNAAGEEAKKQNEEAVAFEATLDRQAQKWQDMVNPVNAYQREIEELEKLYNAGKISADTYAEATFKIQDSIEGAGAKTDEAVEGMSESAAAAAGKLQSVFGDTIFSVLQGNFESMGDGFKSMLDRMVADALAAKLAEAVFGAAGGTGEAGGAGGFAGFFDLFAGLFHGGGIAGQGGIRRRVNPLLFANAPRLHSGGLAGLQPNEVPSILRVGEEVLRRDDPRHVLNGAGQGVSVNFSVQTPDANSFRASRQQLMHELGRNVQNALRRNG